jgi:hypothetical protein
MNQGRGGYLIVICGSVPGQSSRLNRLKIVSITRIVTMSIIQIAIGVFSSRTMRRIRRRDPR